MEQLLAEYLEHWLGSTVGRTVEMLQHVAGDLEQYEGAFFHDSCSLAVLPEPGQVANLLGCMAA